MLLPPACTCNVASDIGRLPFVHIYTCTHFTECVHCENARVCKARVFVCVCARTCEIHTCVFSMSYSHFVTFVVILHSLTLLLLLFRHSWLNGSGKYQVYFIFYLSQMLRSFLARAMTKLSVLLYRQKSNIH